MSAVELSIGLRITGVTRADVRHALWTERSLVKTFGPRGTVHLLPTRDLPEWVGALSAAPPHRSSFPGDAAAPPDPPRGVRLLPSFDAYADVVGNHPRELLYPGRAAERALGNFQALLVDGVVAGVWHQRRSGRKLDITVEPLVVLTPAQRRELDGQVERVGAILDATPRLTIGTVTVGGHA